MKNRSAKESVDRVFVVNDHNDALEKYHYGIRKKMIGFDNISMLHIDAHPDLSVPPFSSDVFFDPQELYVQIANSPFGIGEFIIPFCYQGHMDRIMWLRPPWTIQIRDGTSKIPVGKMKNNPDGPLKVVSAAPYYVDDDAAVATIEELEADSVKYFNLHVSEIPKDHKQAHAFLFQDTSKIKNSNWILDICLDYFITLNPFVYTLEQRAGKDASKQIKDIVMSTRWFKLEQTRTIIEADNGIEEAKLLTLKQRDEEKPFKDLINKLYSVENKNADESVLLGYVEKLSQYIDQPLDIAKTMVFDMIQAHIKANIFQDDESLECVRDAVEYISLPIHDSSEEEIIKMVNDLEIFLKNLTRCSLGDNISSSQSGNQMKKQKRAGEDEMQSSTEKELYHEPGIITIARSTPDYTPKELEKRLVGLMFDMIKRIWPLIPIPDISKAIQDDHAE